MMNKDTIIPFGKYKGKTAGEVLILNPAFLLRMNDKKILLLDIGLYAQARHAISNKTSNIMTYKIKTIDRKRPDVIALSDHPMVTPIGECKYYYSQSSGCWIEVRLDYLNARNEEGQLVGMDGISHAVYALNKLADVMANCHILVIARQDKFSPRVRELIAIGLFNMMNGLRRLIAAYDKRAYENKGRTGPKWWEPRGGEGYNLCWHYHRSQKESKEDDRDKYAEWLIGEAMQIADWEETTEAEHLAGDTSEVAETDNPKALILCMIQAYDKECTDPRPLVSDFCKENGCKARKQAKKYEFVLHHSIEFTSFIQKQIINNESTANSGS